MDTHGALQLSGRAFGALNVIDRAPTPKGDTGTWWRCRCVCGVECVKSGRNLNSGQTRSCGDTQKHPHRARSHGAARRHAKTAEYRVWRGMIARCHYETDPTYRYYGARGISVCAEWRTDFAAFLAHVGARPSDAHSIDRIDNSRGYEPGNVRWATRIEQNNNRRYNHRITVNGVTRTRAEWCRIFGIQQPTYDARVRRGWDDVRAATTPPDQKHAPRRRAETTASSEPTATLCLRCNRWHQGPCDVDPTIAATVARANAEPEDFVARLDAAMQRVLGARL